jgi:hypothetical protein
MVLVLVGLAGCLPTVPGEKEVEQEEKDSTKDDKAAKDDDVIVAGTVDTSSDYSFEVIGACVGMEEYSDEPVVILLGEFTNNSDEAISSSWALDCVAYQSGHELRDAYLRGAGAYTYDNIEPGVTTPVLIGWKLVSATDSIEITVIDRKHYAKEVLFQEKYTVEQLLANTKKLLDGFDGVVDEGKDFVV